MNIQFCFRMYDYLNYRRTNAQLFRKQQVSRANLLLLQNNVKPIHLFSASLTMQKNFLAHYFFKTSFRPSLPSVGVIHCTITLILHYVYRFVDNPASCHCISHQVGPLQSTSQLPLTNSQKTFPSFKEREKLTNIKRRIKDQ